MDAQTRFAVKWGQARRNLSMVALLSLVNVALETFNVGLSFPFSASFPVIMTGFALYAKDIAAMGWFIACFLAAFGSIAFYGACYQLSAKFRLVMIAALAGFCLDTLFLAAAAWFFGLDVSTLIDAAFHVWVLYYLVNGVRAWRGLKDAGGGEE